MPCMQYKGDGPVGEMMHDTIWERPQLFDQETSFSCTKYIKEKRNLDAEVHDCGLTPVRIVWPGSIIGATDKRWIVQLISDY
jgi:hypothetical protein